VAVWGCIDIYVQTRGEVDPYFQLSVSNWGYEVAKKDIHKLWHVLDILKSLLRDGLLGVDILCTFISHRVQPLRRREMTLWR
jgi:hypothetical protein